jgi:hypothetical protein
MVSTSAGGQKGQKGHFSHNSLIPEKGIREGGREEEGIIYRSKRIGKTLPFLPVLRPDQGQSLFN